MKSKIFTVLMLATAMSSGFSAGTSSTTVSTLKQRSEMIQEAFKDSPEEAIKKITEKQQADVKADDGNYVVVIKKESDGKYIRVAHFKKEKLNQTVEQSIVNIMQDAEAKLAGASGPVSFSFSAGEKKLFAVISKHGDLFVFNICPTQEEVDGLLKATSADAVKVEEVKPVDVVKPAAAADVAVKVEEVKAPADAVKVEEVKAPTDAVKVEEKKPEEIKVPVDAAKPAAAAAAA